MSARRDPLLHRDDPGKRPLTGHVKVTREDWLNLARNILVNDGVAEVKILVLANRLGVSRSSFYWYFTDRTDLLNSLLKEWETRNTAQIIDQCQMPAHSIAEAVCHFFLCFIDRTKFDQGLDFAVREWSRRDDALRARVDEADTSRIAAVTDMFVQHGYESHDADARARIVYFMQLGYHALEINEGLEARLSRVEPYLRGFTGREPEPDVIEAFLHAARSMYRT